MGSYLKTTMGSDQEPTSIITSNKIEVQMGIKEEAYCKGPPSCTTPQQPTIYRWFSIHLCGNLSLVIPNNEMLEH